MMNPVTIIVKKRNGDSLNHEEITYFINEFIADNIPDYQMAALAMAIYFQGMTDEETTALTEAMAASGDMLDPHIGLREKTVIVDKHSSGGIGDKASLVVGPIVAACGLPVGKMSGRGLGFTGGTLDKLESIPGWRCDLSDMQFREQLNSIGLVIAGQTATLAPADKRLYALRDVTGTVGSLPLIASSIMCKKLAAGADAIVLDVKCGNGAFMENLDEAKALAKLMVAIGQRAGRKMTALITQMDQPLGQAVGNALEVKEAIATLEGNGPDDFTDLVKSIVREMISLGTGKEPSPQLDAQIEKVIENGSALEKFESFVVAQGGDGSIVRKPEKLPKAPITKIVEAGQSGYIQRIQSNEIGLAAMALGGGRQQTSDIIDHRVGVICHAKVGEYIEAGAPLYTIHAATESSAEAGTIQINAAYRIGPEQTDPLPIVYETIRGERT